MKTMIEARGLIKRYEDEVILNGISMSVSEGEFVAVMGKSGSGKSTLLYNLSGMDRADAGTVLFEGEELAKLSDEEISTLRLIKMGFIFQHSYLLKTLSIRDNIVLPGFKAGLTDRDQVCRYAQELMERMGISETSEHAIHKVSGGQLQRAAICRALMNHPRVLFGDEPTGALNTKSAKELMELLSEIHKEGTAILLVTHDKKAAAYADRVIFLSDGCIKDEISFSGCEVQPLPERESKLSTWLEKMDF